MKFLGTVATVAAVASAEVYFKETFADGAAWEERWVASNTKGKDGGKFTLDAGEFYGDAEADKGIKTSEDAKFYNYAAPLTTAFSNEGKDLVIQFSVAHKQKIDCGGGYIKLFPSNLDPATFNGDSEYNIMFGPDVCGSNKKVHVIFNYKGKNHLIEKEISIADKDDKLTHVYTLIVKPDQTYEVRIDGTEKQTGNLIDDWKFLAPKKIKDPDQSKPTDWVDEVQIDDPEDVKPEGYDDIPAEIVDSEAEKPDDWDDEDDGEWEAPTVPNPEYKGPWKAKRIPNPEYKGPWKHPEIDNPEFVEDKEIYKYADNAYVGFDLWQVKSGTIFDNIIVTDDIAEAEKLLEETYTKNKDAEKEALEVIKKKEEEAAEAAAEADRKKEEEEMISEEDDDDEDWDADEDEDAENEPAAKEEL